jgi:MFS transporter, DHA1 family, inner membrane transport protein
MTSAEAPAVNARAALVTLGFTAFVLGTAEFVIVGVLDLVARDLRVSIATAGHLVMAYALGISFGGPIVTALTVRMNRKWSLSAALLIFIAVNLLMALSSEHYLLLGARFGSGAVHGLFVGVASIAAMELVPSSQRGRAMSMVFGGVALATVLGVPVGTYIAQLAGWRAGFLVISALALLSLCATLIFLPRSDQRRGPGFVAQVKNAFAPRVLAMLGVALLVIGGQFSAFTYMAPYLKGVTRASAESIGLYLLLYGAAGAAGMFAGGKFADRNPIRTLIIVNVTLLPTLAILYWFGSVPLVAAAALAVWGFLSFALVPSLQLRVVSLARCGADLAATLSASAVNVGIAIGSLIGGWALTNYGLDSVVLLGLALCVVALPATIASRNLGSNHAVMAFN